MRYVLDASVAVAALRTVEPFHADALRRCLLVFDGTDEIVVPAIFDVEVMSALVRRGVPGERVASFLGRHLARRSLVTVGPRAARRAQRVVERTGLRAADALYVWVAAREGIPLVTADREVLSRAARIGVLAVVP
jgi:predicted nucleic acid-binding protein